MSEFFKKVLITSPRGFFVNDHTQNIFEKHQSLWTLDDFRKYSFVYEEEPATFVCVIEKPGGRPQHRFILSPLERAPLKRLSRIVLKNFMNKIRNFLNKKN